MNCPECGAPVSADEKFCGNCGTPLQVSAPQVDAEPMGQKQPADIQLPTDQDTMPADVEPAWRPAEQETIYSEPTEPAQETYVPGPPTIGQAPAPEKGNKNKTIIIAIVVLVVLLLCCCIAVIAVLLLFGPMEGGQSLQLIVPSLTTAL
jgi:hypothetical protein